VILIPYEDSIAYDNNTRVNWLQRFWEFVSVEQMTSSSHVFNAPVH